MPYGLVKSQAVQEEALLVLLDPEGESIMILWNTVPVGMV